MIDSKKKTENRKKNQQQKKREKKTKSRYLRAPPPFRPVAGLTGSTDDIGVSPLTATLILPMFNNIFVPLPFPFAAAPLGGKQLLSWCSAVDSAQLPPFPLGIIVCVEVPVFSIYCSLFLSSSPLSPPPYTFSSNMSSLLIS